MCASFLLMGNTAWTATSLGIYVGAGGGESDIRLDRSLTSTFNDISKTHTAWKALVGVRPIPFLGAEVQYVDFGNPSYTSGTFPKTNGVIHQKAEALFGTVYAPIPVSFFDVYGKVGPAHLQTTVSGQISGLFCPAHVISCGVISVNRRSTGLGYGAGVQLKLGAAAVRTEYVRINSSGGDPDMLSLDLIWRF